MRERKREANIASELTSMAEVVMWSIITSNSRRAS